MPATTSTRPVADDAELLAWVETQAAGKSAEIVAAYRKIYPKKTAVHAQRR